MALESRLKLSVDNFSPESDLIEVYSKKAGVIGVINPSQLASPPSGVSGAIQFSNGSAFASDAANLFWDDTNNRLGVGTNAPAYTFDLQSTSADPIRLKTTSPYFRSIYQNAGSSGIFDFNSSSFQFPTNNVEFGTSSSLGARVGIKGSGSTSATTSLLVQNSAGTAAVTVKDDLSTTFGGDVSAMNANVFRTSAYSYWQIINGLSGTIMYCDSTTVRLNNKMIVGTVASNAVASAQFQIDSTTTGFLPPRMTEAQILAIASPAIGLMAYNTDKDCPVFYSAAGWRKVSHSAM